MGWMWDNWAWAGTGKSYVGPSRVYNMGPMWKPTWDYYVGLMRVCCHRFFLIVLVNYVVVHGIVEFD